MLEIMKKKLPSSKSHVNAAIIQYPSQFRINVNI